MDELVVSAESRWRLSQQTLGVCELAGDLRGALLDDSGQPTGWPADLMAGSAVLGDDLRVQGEQLTIASRHSSSVNEGHRALVALNEAGHDDVDRTRLLLGSCRDELLRLAVGNDVARDRANALERRLASVEAQLSLPPTDE